MSAEIVSIRPGVNIGRQRALNDLQQGCNRAARLAACLAQNAELLEIPTVAAAIDSAQHALTAAAYDLEQVT